MNFYSEKQQVPNPIVTEKHKAFARAVVALAREHQMNNINMSFEQSFFSQESSHQVKMEWREGRHGVKSEIQMTCDYSRRVSETIKDGE